jgi:Flp pilus assembly pilin Flp
VRSPADAWLIASARPHARGQGLVEYGLILALTSVLTAVWLLVFGGAVADALAAIASAIDAATGG